MKLRLPPLPARDDVRALYGAWERAQSAWHAETLRLHPRPAVVKAWQDRCLELDRLIAGRPLP